jgi:hypothetical protein
MTTRTEPIEKTARGISPQTTNDAGEPWSVAVDRFKRAPKADHERKKIEQAQGCLETSNCS